MEKNIQFETIEKVFFEAQVLRNDEKITDLYSEVIIKTAEIYGENSTAFRTITNGINTNCAKGSQYFWIANLMGYLPAHQTNISLEDMEAINNKEAGFFQSYYTYIPEVILRTDIPSRREDVQLLNHLVKQVKYEGYDFSSENPLRISGLNLVKDTNPENYYGLLLNIGNDTVMINDKRFSKSMTGCEIPFGKRTKKIWTETNGISSICLGGGGYLYTDGGFVLYSDCVCKVVLKNQQCKLIKI